MHIKVFGCLHEPRYLHLSVPRSLTNPVPPFPTKDQLLATSEFTRNQSKEVMVQNVEWDEETIW